MPDKKMINIYLFTRFERLWHWLQMFLIFTLLLSGFEVHGLFTLFGFHIAVKVHNYVGLTWLISFAFFAFWIFTTGEWKQYIPTTKKMLEVVYYYSYGIFKGEEHPVKKRKEAKHNPLQRLVYLSIAVVALPIQMFSGFLYWGYNSWNDWGIGWLNLEVVVFVHMAVAFGILSFIIVHVYMTTTGHNIFSHIRAMITGWEEVEEDTVIEEWEKKVKT
ncbi:MAG: cytochrome b [Desulfobacterales bacterium]|nr:cytochrome b [Desulfobacterales bacterium]